MTEQTGVAVNGEVKAPEVFHRALDQLYRWMAESNAPDGMTTIRAKGVEPDEPGVICADLSIIVYHEREAESDEEASDPTT